MTSISIHIANQSSYHDDKSTLQCFTCVFCPQLIRNVRSRRRIDSSSIIAHPLNTDLHTWERSLKCHAPNPTYIYIYIYDALDNRYGFSMSVQHGIDCTIFHSFFSWQVWKKKVFLNFQKLAGLGLVGEVDNHVAIYGSKVAEGFSAFQRRSCNHSGQVIKNQIRKWSILKMHLTVVVVVNNAHPRDGVILVCFISPVFWQVGWSIITDNLLKRLCF